MVTLLAGARSLRYAGNGRSTLYSNLGTGTDVYYCCEGWTISGTGSIGAYQSIAEEFQVGMNGNAGQIDVGVGYVEGNPQIDVLLYQGNSPGGTKLGEWDNLPLSQSFGGCCGLVTITGLSIPVSTGTNYWLVVQPLSLSDTLWGAWNFSNSATGQMDFSTDGGQTWNNGGVTNQGAFDVLSGPPGTTPEPTSLLLFGTGVLGAIGAFRRKIKL